MQVVLPNKRLSTCCVHVTRVVVCRVLIEEKGKPACGNVYPSLTRSGLSAARCAQTSFTSTQRTSETTERKKTLSSNSYLLIRWCFSLPGRHVQPVWKSAPSVWHFDMFACHLGYLFSRSYLTHQGCRSDWLVLSKLLLSPQTLADGLFKGMDANK